MGSLRALTGASDATASALTDALQSNMDAVADSVESICDDLEDAVGDVEGISSDAAAALDRVSSAAGSASDTVKRTRAFLADMENSLLSMAHRFDNLVVNDLKNAGFPLPSFSGNLEQNLKQAIDPYLSVLDRLWDDLRRDQPQRRESRRHHTQRRHAAYLSALHPARRFQGAAQRSGYGQGAVSKYRIPALWTIP